jgi:hypothetical protein
MNAPHRYDPETKSCGNSEIKVFNNSKYITRLLTMFE